MTEFSVFPFIHLVPRALVLFVLRSLPQVLGKVSMEAKGGEAKSAVETKGAEAKSATFRLWPKEQLKGFSKMTLDLYQSAVFRASFNSNFTLLLAATAHLQEILDSLDPSKKEKVPDAEFQARWKVFIAICTQLTGSKTKTTPENKTTAESKSPPQIQEVVPPTESAADPSEAPIFDQGDHVLFPSECETQGLDQEPTQEQLFATLTRLQRKYATLYSLHNILKRDYHELAKQFTKKTSDLWIFESAADGFKKQIEILTKELGEWRAAPRSGGLPSIPSTIIPSATTIAIPTLAVPTVFSTDNTSRNPVNTTGEASQSQGPLTLGQVKELFHEQAGSGFTKTLREQHLAIFAEGLNAAFDLDQAPSSKYRDILGNNGGSTLYSQNAKKHVLSDTFKFALLTLRNFTNSRADFNRSIAMVEFHQNESFKIAFSHLCALLLADDYIRQNPAAEQEFQKLYDVLVKTMITPVSQQVFRGVVGNLFKKDNAPALGKTAEKAATDGLGSLTATPVSPTKDSPSPRCFHCQKFGHIAKQCRARLAGEQRVPAAPGMDGSLRGVPLRTTGDPTPQVPIAATPVPTLTAEQRRAVLEAEFQVSLRRAGF